MLYAVIIAGGIGKRLWPKSRKAYPKYLMRFKGKKSLIQLAVERAMSIVSVNNIIIMSNEKHRALIIKELPYIPKKHIIGEPVLRNTAGAICLAASFVARKDPHGVMLVFPADQLIGDKRQVKRAFRKAAQAALISKKIITMGIKPAYPACGYGYIKVGKKATDDRVYQVDRFIEKPQLKKARQLVSSNDYLWNSGIFIAKAEVLLREFARHAPRVLSVCEKIRGGLGTSKQSVGLRRYYRDLPDISIDYAIMEKSKNVLVMRSDITWHDLGSWASLDECVKPKINGNHIEGKVITYAVKDSVLLSDNGHLLAVCGVKDIVLIHTPDATLLCRKDKAQDVKALVEQLNKKGFERFL